MPGRTTAAHGAFRSGRTLPQRFPLRSGIFTHVPELSRTERQREDIFCPAFPGRGSRAPAPAIEQWKACHFRGCRFFMRRSSSGRGGRSGRDLL